MEGAMPTGNNTIHSDFIIHWTGKDIDIKYPESEKTKERIEQYLDRLKLLLKHGLWMMIEEEQCIKDGNKCFNRPLVSRTCFTELKLSEVTEHAKIYGSLGIGFKRFFLFDHLGCPMIYYPTDISGRENWAFPPLFESGSNDFRGNDYFSCFLKPMYIKNPGCDYKIYDESEWRIIYSEEIKNKLISLNKISIPNKFKSPDLSLNDPNFKKAFEDSERKPQYLIPFSKKEYDSRWFAMIIYPDTYTKIAAEADLEIRNLIREIKPDSPDAKDIDPKNSTAVYEPYNKPIEISLASCKNF